MSRKPLVGMTYADMAVRDNEMRIRTYCTRKYFQALQRAGAQVILLPPVEEISEMNAYLDLIDGLVLPGGEDVDPRYQNEDPAPKLGIVNPLRDFFEIQITKLAYKRKIPTFGICRGIQVMAIALGGSVHQDISHLKVIQHSQNAPRWASSHKVKLSPTSFLKELIGCDEIFTNSFHHQAVNRIPKGFKAVGKTSDGIVEAIESEENLFFCGVQWHPEEMFFSDAYSKHLFEGFVKSL